MGGVGNVAASKPRSSQLLGARGARSKVKAGRLGSCGRHSDRVMLAASNVDGAGGPLGGACGLVRVELVQDSAMESTLARREPLMGEPVVDGYVRGLRWIRGTARSLASSTSSSAESRRRLREDGDKSSFNGANAVGEYGR